MILMKPFLSLSLPSIYFLLLPAILSSSVYFLLPALHTDVGGTQIGFYIYRCASYFASLHKYEYILNVHMPMHICNVMSFSNEMRKRLLMGIGKEGIFSDGWL